MKGIQLELGFEDKRSLFETILDAYNLRIAFKRVKKNKGAPGIDGISIEEYELIKEHPLISLKIIEPIHELKKAKEYVKYHHEKWDGTGYPDGLKGEAIPLGARILSVADAFDTMWIGRHYHEAWDMDTVIGEFRKNSGTQFDKTVVDAFNHLIVDERAAFDRIREDNPPQFSVAPPFKNPLKI